MWEGDHKLGTSHFRGDSSLPTYLAASADQIVHFDSRISLSGHFDGLLAESVLLGNNPRAPEVVWIGGLFP